MITIPRALVTAHTDDPGGELYAKAVATGYFDGNAGARQYLAVRMAEMQKQVQEAQQQQRQSQGQGGEWGAPEQPWGAPDRPWPTTPFGGHGPQQFGGGAPPQFGVPRRSRGKKR
jgi:hypothetical protein